MPVNYTVRITDRLLRFDTSNDDIVVTLLPFAQTPNAPYEIHRTSFGDGHTVTIQVDPTSYDFLLPDGSTSITLDDTTHSVGIKIPSDGKSPAWVTSGGGGGGGGGGTVVKPAPPVAINGVTAGPVEVIFRSEHRVEVDVPWTADPSANKTNFSGVAVYLEDPDISSGANVPLDSGLPLDGSAQVSGKWAPVFVNDSTKSPAVLFVDSTMGSADGQSYRTGREIRVYLASYGPIANAHLVRATDPSPTPSIIVQIPIGRGQGESGEEFTFLVTDVKVDITTDYNRPDPQYYLTFFYTPPDSTIPIPPGLNRFGGCRIVFVYLDADGNPQFPGTDTAISVPVEQSTTGYKSPAYVPKPGIQQQFRVYFCSEDDSVPLGKHINSLVDGVTPYATVDVPAVPTAPDVTDFQISGQKVVWQLDGSFVAEAKFSWTLPTGDARYSGVMLYVVNVTGTAPLSPFPALLPNGRQPDVIGSCVVDIAKIPAADETWTIAAISFDVNNALSDDPHLYGQAGFHSPTQTWIVGPPAPGSDGSGTEYAPLVTLDSGAKATATETTSSDGLRMVKFDVGTWTNPTDNKFGNAQVFVVLNNGDPKKPAYQWTVPANATSLTSPEIPAPGNFGQSLPMDFYIVSDDPQKNKNSVEAITPKIHLDYTPTLGAVIPARDGWFDPTQFKWDTTGELLQGKAFSASIIQATQKIIVGGAPATFGGNDNGQIAVLDSNSTLMAWIGKQQPDQIHAGQSNPVWGGWFGQLYVGGTSPLDAPLYVNNNGVIVVGGISGVTGVNNPTANNAQYPYISVRDDHGIEMGRIGAKLNVNSGTIGDGVGQTPPPITSGAWFTQLAIGGSNISNWNVLVTPDGTNPLGSNFQMRNVYLFSIDYPARAGNPAMQHYRLEMGNSIWMAGGLNGQWQFPGVRIYEPDAGTGTAVFGSTFLSRGLVLRGTQTQNFGVLASFVTYNGDPNGSDSPANFFAQMQMMSPLLGTGGTRFVTVDIGSGSYSGGTTDGSGYLILRDLNGVSNFYVDKAGVVTVRGSVTAASFGVPGQACIDSGGNWVGKPISAGGQPQTPWAQPINGNGQALSNAGNISSNGTVSANTGFTANGISVINNVGQFVGHGIDVTSGYGIGCGSLQLYGGPINGCGAINMAGNLTTSGWVYANSGRVQAVGFTIYAQGDGYEGTFVTGNAKVATVHGGIIVGAPAALSELSPEERGKLPPDILEFLIRNEESKAKEAKWKRHSHSNREKRPSSSSWIRKGRRRSR